MTRAVAREEFRDWYTACEYTFGNEPAEEELALESALFEPERSLAVLDGTRIVATAGAFSLDLSVPGGSRAVAGVTMVSVATTHRRKGLATSLMQRQLRDVRDRGVEAVAALWASEPAIYGRFGYGLASWGGSLEVPTRTARLRPSPDDGAVTVRPVDNHALPGLASPVHEAMRSRRAGMLRRDDRWWARRLYDPESGRAGGSALRCVVAEASAGAAGYALYSVKPDWQPGGPEHRIELRELVAVTPAAEHALWRYLLEHDLVGALSARAVPVDSALLHLLADPRRAGFRVADNLWVRLVDVRRALSERTYAVDGRVVVDVVDAVCPWNEGRLSIDVSSGSAEVTRTNDDADITAPVDALGAVYLGGTRLAALAAAGRVAVADGSVIGLADAMFATTYAPLCPEVF